MTGVELQPAFAAELAENVYLIKDEFTRKGFTLKYKNDFFMKTSRMVVGKTAGKEHVMAFLGVGQGRYKGQAFVAVKGTASLYDALADLNTGLRSSHTGFAVHQGFYYAFDSILTELRRFLGSIKGVHTIHCVGHSLGGAVVTLAADWIKAANSVSTVKLYTFGSPRVGLEGFASKCTSRLSPNNIYRVYHRTDPIPTVPTWPFYHVAYERIGYYVHSPSSIKPWEYHMMKHYKNSAKKAGTWSRLGSNKPENYLDSSVERWLKSDSALSFTANTLEMLDAALLYVIKKIMHGAGIIIIGAAAAGLTVLDRMAMFMARAVKVSTELSLWVYHLVKRMSALIGIKIKEGVDLTVEFIRMVFIRLYRRLSDMIRHVSREIA